jgi:hypothetical protein
MTWWDRIKTAEKRFIDKDAGYVFADEDSRRLGDLRMR